MTTAAVVAYYRQEGKASISYAGHPPILYRRSGENVWSFAEPSERNGQRDGVPRNLPLAIEQDTRYEEFTIPMVSGDRLFVYTDGIIDTPNPMGERFGLTRLKDVLDANTAVSLAEIKSAVLKALHQFAKKKTFHDDITLVVLEIG